MGVWIETVLIMYFNALRTVTPCVGVWIETLKISDYQVWNNVTPCVGVWIETLIKASAQTIANRGHTLRGCVD